MSSGNPSASSSGHSSEHSSGRSFGQDRVDNEWGHNQGVHHQGENRQQSGRQQNRPRSGRSQQEDSTSLWSSSCDNVGSTERIVSAGLGGLLVASGIFRGRMPGLLLTAVGASLLYRGLSGYCALYQQLGMNTCDIGSDHQSGARGLSQGPLAGMMPRQ